jgi:hypothetical protein
MAISMADFMTRRGAGQEADVSQVALSADDIAKLSRLQAIDPRQSAYPGQAIEQAQGIASELPTSADLGLMVEQNKQLKAAGGRGYVGNVHGYGSGPTPFEQLTSQVAESKLRDEQGQTYSPSGTGSVGEGDGVGYSGSDDLGQLGHFGMEAMTDWGMDLGKKGLLGATAGYSMGMPASMAAKAGFLSSIAPLGILAGMGKMALGATKDMEFGHRMDDAGIAEQYSTDEAIDQANRARAQYETINANPYAAGMFGGDWQSALAAGTRRGMEERSLFGDLQAAYETLQRGPQGGWTSSTKFDPAGTGIHRGLVGAPGYSDLAAVSGLQSTFGDPMGFGGMFGGFDPSQDHKDSDSSAGGGYGGGFGDRESSGGYGGMGGI